MDEQIKRRRKQAEARRRRRRQVIRRRIALAVFLLILLLLGIRAAGRFVGRRIEKSEVAQEQTPGGASVDTKEEDAAVLPEEEAGEAPDAGVTDESEPGNDSLRTDEADASALSFAEGYSPQTKDDTVTITSENVQSSYALLIDLDDNTIVAQKNAFDRISPASMTKIMTVLVAAEHVKDLDDTFTITREMTDYSYSNDASAVGFAVDETVTVRDLMYGTVLPSGADAAAGLATYVAGSLDDFVSMMNEKLDELGLSDSAHFTNCVGFYDENHFCTLCDMAMILKAAVE
ncbi:MAG: hypothetical protein LUE86_00905, partial [Clostridiales bacterium]|nr:hypothetical protein [Clostridiales bacterium]